MMSVCIRVCLLASGFTLLNRIVVDYNIVGLVETRRSLPRHCAAFFDLP